MTRHLDKFENKFGEIDWINLEPIWIFGGLVHHHHPPLWCIASAKNILFKRHNQNGSNVCVSRLWKRNGRRPSSQLMRGVISSLTVRTHIRCALSYVIGRSLTIDSILVLNSSKEMMARLCDTPILFHYFFSFFLNAFGSEKSQFFRF